jgi:hypothetical protein
VLINTTSNPINVIYSYVISYNGCSDTEAVTVIVNPLPVPTINGNTQICIGDSTLLTATDGIFFLWSNSDTTSSINVSPIILTTYSVTVTNTYGCSGTAIDSVTVNPLPTVDFTGLPDSTCSGSGSITLSGNPSGGNFIGNGITGNNFNPDIFLGNDTITYSYTDSLGCTNNHFHIINIITSPSPAIAISGTASFCQGDSVILSTGNYSSYSWSNNSTTDSISVTTTGNYSVTVSDSSGCIGTATQSILVNQLPMVSFTGLPDTMCINGGNKTLTGNPGGGTFTGSGMTLNIFSPSSLSSGNYTITYSYTDTNGCSNAQSHTIFVSPCSGIEELYGGVNNDMYLYPNPAVNEITVSFISTKNESYSILLNDIIGRKIKIETANTVIGINNINLSLDGISKGVYMVTLKKGNGILNRRIVIE